MKAQERHHLKQNEFAVQAAKVAESFSQNRSRIIVTGRRRRRGRDGGRRLLLVGEADQRHGQRAARPGDGDGPVADRPRANAARRDPGSRHLPDRTGPRRGGARGVPERRGGVSVNRVGPRGAVSRRDDADVDRPRSRRRSRRSARSRSRGGTVDLRVDGEDGTGSALVGQTKFDDAIKTAHGHVGATATARCRSTAS